MDLKPYIIRSIQAAIAAGDAINEVYHSEDFGVEYKSDKSPLTLADQKSHEIIMKGLKEFDIPILSEEGKDTPYAQRKEWARFWVVDPLDGTKEFIKRNGEFTVNIALVEHSRPVLGIMCDNVRSGRKTDRTVSDQSAEDPVRDFSAVRDSAVADGCSISGRSDSG